MNFNKVILGGYLARDPELRYLPNGNALCSSAVAVNRSWTTETGEKKEEVTFVDWTAFGRKAEVVAQYFKKGSPILIEGRLRTEKWEDKQTGQPRSKLTVVLEGFSFCGKQEGGGEEGAKPRRPAARTTAPAAAVAGDEPPPKDDDDVPF